MVFRSFSIRFFAGLALSGFVLAVSGCQSSDSASVLNVDGKSAAAPAQAAAAQDGKIRSSELEGFCPKVTLREGTAYFSTYAKGGQDDPTKLAYQASISDVTRSCSRATGALTMTIAVAGRIVPGPQAAAGTVTMPIRVAVTRGGEVLYSQLHQYKVQVSDTKAATQFVFTDANVSVPIPTGREYQAFAGFDEGPPMAKKSEEPKRVVRRVRKPAPQAAQPSQPQGTQGSMSDIPR